MGWLVLVLVLGIAGLSMGQNSPQDFVDAHNEFRAEVGVQPLAWNETVAAYAEGYARQRIDDCKMEHSIGGPYGECLAEGWGGSGFSGVDAVKLWAGEKVNYDYNTNTCPGGVCGHYTQVVWRNTTHLGCARVECRNGWLFIICSYFPPGNYVGQRPY